MAEEQTYLEKLRDVIGTGQATAQMRAAISWFRSMIENYGVTGIRRSLSSETPQSNIAQGDYSPQA